MKCTDRNKIQSKQDSLGKNQDGRLWLPVISLVQRRRFKPG